MPNVNLPAVLVLDGEQRSALATVRSLGRAGYRVHVASQQPKCLAGSSRFAASATQTPNPLGSAQEFVAAIRSLVLKLDIGVLLPVTDASLSALLPHRECLAARLPFPCADAYNRLSDKGAVAAQAERLGMAVPRTIRLESGADYAALSPNSLSFPMVLKPLSSVETVNGKRIRRSVIPIADARALDDAVRAQPDAFPLLLQERISGPGVGVFVILHNGELVAAFAHRRIAEKPPWGGVSVLRESIELDPRLLQQSVDLLKSFSLEGAAMVEYKIDQRSGVPYIMEINGRFWGSLQLAIDAGVDFPTLLLSATLGERKPATLSYKKGVKSRWFWGDVDHLLLQLRRASRTNEVLPRSVGQSVLDFLSAFRPSCKSEVFRWTDPWPGLHETAQWFSALGRAQAHQRFE